MRFFARDVVAAASMFVFATLPSCDRTVAQPLPASSARALPHVEFRTAGAGPDVELPMIVALHGRGDSPERFVHVFDAFTVPVRVVAIRAPHEWGGGYAWFERTRAIRENQDSIARELLQEAERVIATLEAVRAARPTRGAPLLFGFSQGAMLSYTVALRCPSAFRAVFPVSGLFFPTTVEHVRFSSSEVPPILALHGREDSLVSVIEDRRGVELLRQRGVRIELREYSADHTISSEMLRELYQAIERALATE